MAREKNFTETTEGFKKNVTESMKWFQDTTKTIIETQSKQIELASEIWSKVINRGVGVFNKEDSTGPFGWSEIIVELLKTNILTITEMSKSSIKTAADFGKKTSSENSKEMVREIIEGYKKQAEEINAWNKKSFETLKSQFEKSGKSNSLFLEGYKRDYETMVAKSKDKFQSIIDTWSQSKTANSVESNRELWSKLNNQMNDNFNTNLKFWSDLTTEYDEVAKWGRFDTNFKNN